MAVHELIQYRLILQFVCSNARGSLMTLTLALILDITVNSEVLQEIYLRE